ncbi:hypothetical protein FOL47_002936 [Perkinsus chesapeaki]|uniref:Uncharacterized protein n=1 Tax=Perkinsus chesapeaki TaxID=330153 RepID=A0A7J6MAH1_PERCH|nr:hypothetical protein FOL47_002936 [Perkinsus chesapeaki]
MNSGSHSLRRIKKYNGNNSYNKEDCGHRTVELVKALQDLHARQEDLLRQLYNIEGSKGSKDTEGYWSNGDNNVASDGNLEVKANRLDDTLLELGERWLMALDWKGNSRKKHDGLIRLDQSENDDCIIKAWMDKRKDDTVEALRDTSSLLATISLTESSRQKDSIIEEDDDKVLDGCKYMDEGEEESIDTECGKVEDGSKEVTEVNNDTATTTLVDNIQSLIECYSDGGCRLDNQTINRNTLNEVASPVSTAVDIVNKLSPIKRRREELRRLNDRVKNKLLQLTVNQRRLSNMDKKEEEREEYNSYTTIRDYRRNVVELQQRVDYLTRQLGIKQQIIDGLLKDNAQLREKMKEYDEKSRSRPFNVHYMNDISTVPPPPPPVGQHQQQQSPSPRIHPASVLQEPSRIDVLSSACEVFYQVAHHSPSR